MPGVDVSSVEGAAQAVLGMAATGQLASLDPWWRGKIQAYLEATQPFGPVEAFSRARALELLDRPATASVEGSGLDAIAYRVLLGGGEAHDLARFQVEDGGFTLAPDGGAAEALPTALALVASRPE